MHRSTYSNNLEVFGEKSSGHLLVMNYVMDKSHPALSHQVDTVESLAAEFNLITVLTGYSNWVPTFDNIRIVSTSWNQGQNFRNVLRFFKGFFAIISTTRFTSVFSHMTLIQSSLAAPILRILGIPHYLWYAHAQNSSYLRWAHFWVTRILTSTPGSCPLSGAKVSYLGQAIDEGQFIFKSNLNYPLKRCVHVGRLDPSKNINLIISSVKALKVEFPDLQLDFVGKPSDDESQQYLDEIQLTYQEDLRDGWLKFHNAIPREMLPARLRNFDIFVHAFSGSLDKTLVEATMSGLAVATTNSEYWHEFGVSHSSFASLSEEILTLLHRTPDQLKELLSERREIAETRHAKNIWVSVLSSFLRNERN